MQKQTGKPNFSFNINSGENNFKGKEVLLVFIFIFLGFNLKCIFKVNNLLNLIYCARGSNFKITLKK
jgi:hypothetical protein